MKSVGSTDVISSFTPSLNYTFVQLNVLISSTKRVIITDFGSARPIGWDRGSREQEEINYTVDVDGGGDPHRSRSRDVPLDSW